MLLRCKTCAMVPDESRTPAARFQDARYGHNIRVHNERKRERSGEPPRGRCVVCLTEQAAAAPPEK